MKKYCLCIFLVLFTSILWSQQLQLSRVDRIYKPDQEKLLSDTWSKMNTTTSCSSWTFQANYDFGAPFRNYSYDLVQLSNSNYVVSGMETGATYMGRLTKLNNRGEALITRLVPVGIYLDLLNIREFSNGNLYAFGTESDVAPFTPRPTFVVIDSSNFNFLSVKSLIPSAGPMRWWAADIAEGENNEVYVFSYNDSLVNVTKLNGSNYTVTWSKSYRARNNPRAFGLAVEGSMVYACWNETDSGYNKGVVIALESTTGNYLYGCRVGGGTEKLNIELQSMVLDNQRPRISGLQWKDNQYQSMRLNFSAHLLLEDKEIFDIAGLVPGKSTITRQSGTGEVIAHDQNGNTKEIFLSFSDQNNIQDPFMTSKISFAFPVKLQTITRSMDEGIAILTDDEWFLNQSKVTKTDSKGNLPGCGNIITTSSITRVFQSYQKDTIPSTPIIFATTTPPMLPSQNYFPRTNYKCIEEVPVINNLELGSDSTLCPGNSLKLRAGPGFDSYLWQDGTTDSVLIATSPGLYHVQVTSCGGTILKDSVTITAAPAIPFTAGPDRIKCKNDTVHLNATAGFINYYWSNNYNINSLNSATVVVNPLMDTSYYVKAEKTPGCFAYDTVKVSIVHSPDIRLGNDTSFCTGNSIMLDAGNGFSDYLWNDGSTSQQLQVKTSGIYSVIGTGTMGCKSYDTIKVLNVWPLPVVALDKSPELCAGSSKILDPGVFNSYLWHNGSTDRTFVVSGIGKYYVEVRDANNCVGSDTSLINIITPLPAAFLPDDTAICSYNTITISSNSIYNRYNWSTGGISPAIIIDKPGFYWLDVTDNKNCKGRDSIIVNPKQCMAGVFVPNAFTPTHDRKNDIFRPLISGNVKLISFTVYDRWGQVVFTAKDVLKGWNGEINGKLMPIGIYVWQCHYEMDGKKQKQKGTVLLVR